ncbi:hypothetical protein HC031_30260 [Planosporangium thailandense]|uniref:DUF2771 family protein n=1 Tax=Planosporangium thailandense TaxID=765197 RepID=A0ABX0Y6D0_9ACTN|nr:hypothetical protein [Planosporangium thailandense]NJC73965.1 hypothetical protein [Planosporangium thailandense]
MIVIIDSSFMRRSLAVAVAAVMAWISLGACYLGPDPVQYAALSVIAGRPTAVVAVCERSTVRVELYLNDHSRDGELHLWSVTVTPPNRVQDVEVELLGTARPGWEITSNEEKIIGASPGSFKVVPLTSIETGHHYTLDSSTGGPEGASAPAVTFTTDDLPRIGAGQVLAPIDHKRSKVVSRSSFVKERCG